MVGRASAPSQDTPADRDLIGPLTVLAGADLVGAASLAEVLRRSAVLAADLLRAPLGAAAAAWDGAAGAFGERIVTGRIAAADDLSPGPGRHVLDHAVPLTVSDVAADGSEADPWPASLGARSFAAVPIRVAGRDAGVLYALDVHPRRFSADEIRLLELLAGRTAVAIEGAQLIVESRASRDRSEALAWVANALIAADDLSEVLQSVVDGAAAGLLAAHVELVTIDDQRRVLEEVVGGVMFGASPVAAPRRALSGLPQWVLDHGRLALSTDVLEDPRESPENQDRHRASALGPGLVVPLRFGRDTVFGTLAVYRDAGASGFVEAEIDLVIAMASQAAVAIQNVRLIEATRSSLRESNTLFSVSQALATASGLEEILEVMAAGAGSALPADHVTVHVLWPGSLEVLAARSVGHGPEVDMAELLELGGTELSAGTALAPDHPASRRVGHGGPTICAPLRVHDRLLGAVTAVNRSGGGDFAGRQLDLLMTLAAHAAAAIDGTLLLGEVQRLAITDDLTGAFNRRHLFELADREYEQAERYERPIAAIMFDLDRFKDINDSFGHAVGDEVLRAVADHCREVVRKADVWGRYGGEEFAIVLPETGLEGAVELAERLRARVAAHPVPTHGGPVRVTISAGVAEKTAGMRDVHALIDRADAAMYFAKRTGRNRVEGA